MKAAFAVVFATVYTSLVVEPVLGTIVFYPDYFYDIPEDQAVGTTIGSYTITDSNKRYLKMEIRNGKEYIDLVDASGKLAFDGWTPMFRKIRIKKGFDYETKKYIYFSIHLRDTGEEIHYSFIYPQDTNDEIPIFQNTPYKITIMENTPRSSLFTVYAKDRDEKSKNNVVSYSFSSSCTNTDCKPFSIDSTTGKVSIRKWLDYEQQIRYDVVIVAKDNGSPTQSGTTTLVVTVTDEDDNRPQFEKTSYSANINTLIPVGSSVVHIKAYDGDRGLNHPIEYVLIAGNIGDYFTLDTSTGLITTRLNMEEYQYSDLSFTVKATEVPSRKSSYTFFPIIIEKIINNVPRFDHSQYSFTVNELAGTGTVLGQITATDDDIDKYGIVTHSLFGNGAEKFSVVSDKGTISIASSLDFEIKESYSLELEARDGGNKFTRVQVNIAITNVNENTPKFDSLKTTFDFTINELTGSGTVLGQITASDTDSGDFGKVTYSLFGNGAEKFSVVPDKGTISVASSLDFELKNIYSLQLEAKDGGNRFARVQVNIAVTDANDNTPQFDPLLTSADFTLSELAGLGTIVGQITATDADSGEFGKVTYSLLGDDAKKFSVILDKGTISLVGTVDFELKQSYSFELEAKDGGNKFTRVPVNIAITDVNDNTPVFDPLKTLADFTINEMAGLGTVLGQITATDADSGEFGKVTYTLFGDGVEKFSVIPDRGTISVASNLDFEMKQSYSLELEAKDGGNNFARVQVNIAVTDANDNSPKFDPLLSSADFTLNELAELGTVVGQITATDADSCEFGTVTYSLVFGDGGASKFSVNLDNGTISLVGTVDFELRQSYSFELEAKDGGNRFTHLPVNIAITNANDNTPEFDHFWASADFTLNELVELGTVLGQITATDADSGEFGKVTYSLLGDGAEKFSVILDNGTISVASPLDFELKQNYSLELEAKDGGNIFTRLPVNIVIINANDNLPEFSSTSVNFTLNELAESGTVLGQITAIDADLDEYGIVTYGLFGDGAETFSVVPDNGTISVASPLDFELKQSYSLELEAKDGGKRFTRLPVNITIINANDNTPEFSSTSVNFTLNELVESGKVLGKITATDADLGEYGIITYSLFGDGAEKFSVVPHNGTISVASPLDFELKQNYSLELEAKDGGNIFTRLPVKIIIANANDNMPEFVLASVNYNLNELVESETVLGQITATDADLDEYGIVTYSLFGDGAEKFSVNQDNGTIALAGTVDFEVRQSYSLELEAKDGGNRTTRLPVNIAIIDVNDNTPKFDTFRTVYIHEFIESEFSFTAKATDKDSGNNSAIRYSIGDGDPLNNFTINNVSGEIKNVGPPDFETTSNFSLVIFATDLGSPSRNTTQTLLIKLEPLTNHHSPQFNKSQCNFTINELAASGTVLGRITATDADRCEYGIVTYSLFGDGAEKFSVNFHNGTISVASSPDFELKQSYSLELEAKDGGNITTRLPVDIFITDANDNTPEFDPLPTSVNLTEYKESFFSFIMKATDKDSGNNSAIRYSIVGGDPLNNFTINNVSGEIKNIGAPDFETTKHFSLVIMATDLGSPSRNTTDTLLIKVNTFVLVDNKKVHLTLGLNDTDFIQRNINEIIKALSDATCLEFKFDSMQNHLQDDGKYDLSKIDIFVYALNPKTKDAVPKNTVFELIDTNYGRIFKTLRRYKVSPVETKKLATSRDKRVFELFLVIAFVLGGLLVTVLLSFLFAVYLLRRRHSRKLREAEVLAKEFHIYETILSSASKEQNNKIITPSGSFTRHLR